LSYCNRKSLQFHWSVTRS